MERKPQRRGAGWTGIGLCLLTAAAAILTAGCANPGPSSRHLVLVVLDTLRADRMSVYGYDRPTTPFLEAASGQLVRFAAAKAPAPWTMPSHASLFTGLWPSEHGVGWGHKNLDPELWTLAETLDARDFCTFGLSANPTVSDVTGFDQGFDDFQRVPRPAETQTERLLAAVPELLERRAATDCRLFLFLNLMTTHTPYDISEYGPLFGIDGPSPIDRPGIKWQVNAGRRRLGDGERRHNDAAYDASIRTADRALERLFEMLSSRGLLEESTVVITSDHGEGLGEHGQLGHVIGVWEQQLAVPLLVRFPGAWRGGEVVSGPVSTAHLAATALDWLDVPRPPELHRAATLESQHPVLADYRSYFDPAFEANAHIRERFPELSERVPHAHVTYCSDYKLVVNPGGEARLFRLSRDPGEQQDVSATDSSAMRRCAGRYAERAREGLFTPFDASPTDSGDSEDVLEALRSLGYIQ